MSAQRLSEKNVRRWIARLGLPIVRMWAHGGSEHWLAFVTDDHKHGYVHQSDGTVEWETDVTLHYTSCQELFPEYQPEQVKPNG